MKRYDFKWTSKTVEHTEKGIVTALPLATKALGVVYKYFLIPMANHDLNRWKKQDYYRHHITELEADGNDEVWIRPWIVGGWLDEKESVFEFEPMEYNEEAFGKSLWAKLIHWRQHHKRGALFGIYLTVTKKVDNWNAVFAFRLEDKPDAHTLNDLPVREALCLSIDGDKEKVDAWLDWAFREGRVA